MSEGYSKPIFVSSFPYHSGFLNVPQSTSGGGAMGIWYAYFTQTSLPSGGEVQVVGVAGIGTSGNGDLFESVGDGVRVKAEVIVQATAWGLVLNATPADKWLGIQLDKDGTLLVRAHTAFNQKAANITYGGVLAEGNILRAVGCNHATAADSIEDGWISVIATPI